MIRREVDRRSITTLLVLLALNAFVLLSWSIVGAAEEFPAKPIVLNVGYAPGGGAGNSAQVFADGAMKYLPKKQPILVNYKPGAGTALSADYVLKQPADGYNLVWMSVDLVAKLASDGDKLSFGLKDFSYIGTVGDVPQVVAVRTESRFTRFGEFIDYARKHPGEVSYGSSGMGGHGHLTMEVLQQRCGVKLNHVPFSGSGAFMTALLGGHIDIINPSLASAAAYIQPGGGMRVLAVLTAKRVAELADVPTALEMGCDVVRPSWFGLAAPKGTPEPVVKILRETFSKATTDREMVINMSKLGIVPPIRDAEGYEKFAQSDFGQFKEIFRKLGSR